MVGGVDCDMVLVEMRDEEVVSLVELLDLVVVELVWAKTAPMSQKASRAKKALPAMAWVSRGR